MSKSKLNLPPDSDPKNIPAALTTGDTKNGSEMLLDGNAEVTDLQEDFLVDEPQVDDAAFGLLGTLIAKPSPLVEDLQIDEDFQAAQDEVVFEKKRIDEIAELRFRDHLDSDFWLGKGILREALKGKMWANGRNPDLLMLSILMPHLMALIPQNVRYQGPLGKSVKALWIFAHTNSAGGKGAAFNAVRPFIDAIRRLDDHRNQLRHQAGQPKDGIKLEIDTTYHRNNSLAATTPRMIVGDTTIEALMCVSAAHAEYDRLTTARPGEMPGIISTGLAVVHSEGSVLARRFDLSKGTAGSASILNMSWSGETVRVTRKTNSEYTESDTPISMAATMIGSEIPALLIGDNNGKDGNKTPNGFTGRLLTIASEKTSDEEFGLTEAEDDEIAERDKILTTKITEALSIIQINLWTQGVVRWTPEARTLYDVEKTRLKSEFSIEKTPLYKSFTDRLISNNVVSLAFAFAICRQLDKPENHFEIIPADVIKAFEFARAANYDRIYFCEKLAMQEVAKIVEERSNRSANAANDKWYDIFSDPKATYAWVQGHKANGESRVQITKRIAGKIMKRLRTQYNINVTDEIKKHY